MMFAAFPRLLPPPCAARGYDPHLDRTNRGDAAVARQHADQIIHEWEGAG
jgi:hypothetical protein